MMAVAPNTPKLVARFGADKVGMAGLLFVAAGLVGIALFGTDTGYLQLVVTMCVLAAGMALTMTPMTTQLMAAVPRDRAGHGLGDQRHDPRARRRARRRRARLARRQPVHVGRGLGRRRAARRRSRRSPRAASAASAGLVAQGVRPGRAALLDVAKEAFVDGLTLAATVGAVIVVIAALIVKRFLPSDRNDPEITGEPETAAVGVD